MLKLRIWIHISNKHSYSKSSKFIKYKYQTRIKKIISWAVYSWEQIRPRAVELPCPLNDTRDCDDRTALLSLNEKGNLKAFKISSLQVVLVSLGSSRSGSRNVQFVVRLPLSWYADGGLAVVPSHEGKISISVTTWGHEFYW